MAPRPWLDQRWKRFALPAGEFFGKVLTFVHKYFIIPDAVEHETLLNIAYGDII